MSLRTLLKGAASADDSGPSVDGDMSAPDLAALAKKARTAGGSSGTNRALKRAREEADAAEIERLWEGENWGEISALYFNARFVMTGFAGFKLDDKEKKILGTTLAASMKMLVKIDPGYLALTLFATNFGGLIMSKELVYSNLRRRARQEAAKAKAAEAGAPVPGS